MILQLICDFSGILPREAVMTVDTAMEVVMITDMMMTVVTAIIK